MKPGPSPEIGTVELLREVVLHPDVVVTAPEIADRLSFTRQGVTRRMNQLVDEGLLASKKAGHHARVYWVTSTGRQYLDSARDYDF